MKAERSVIERADGYKLSIFGGVFMGHIVKLLKKPEGRRVLDAYIAEGYEIGNAIKQGNILQTNGANNRQTINKNGVMHVDRTDASL